MTQTTQHKQTPKTEPDLDRDEIRSTVFDRDGFACKICDCEVIKRKYEPGPTGNIHHITPVSEGGATIPGNLVTLCESCHRSLHRDRLDADSFEVRGKTWMHESVFITDSMVEILDWFAEQPCSCATIGHISDATGWSRETVCANLKQLRAGDYAERMYKPTGEHRLINDPREDQ